MRKFCHEFWRFFDIRLKQFYNPGLVTGLFGIDTVVIIYLFTAFDSGLYVWYDYVLGILYFFASFFFCYRSPLYWRLGRIKGYPLSDRSSYGMLKELRYEGPDTWAKTWGDALDNFMKFCIQKATGSIWTN